MDEEKYCFQISLFEGSTPENKKKRFIYNYFDESEHCIYGYVQAVKKNEEYTVGYCIKNNVIDIGVWMIQLPLNVFEAIVKKLFDKYPSCRKVCYENSLTEYLKNCSVSKGNHWTVYLPNSYEELINRQSPKTRQTIRRKKRMAEEAYGSLKFFEFSANNVPDEYVEWFFRRKTEQFEKKYCMTPAEYLENYYVSNVYVLIIANEIGAVLFSSEQGEIVYLENLAYNEKFGKYSLGAILYEYFLEKCIERNKYAVYLGGGKQQYKEKYNAIENVVFSGVIYKKKQDYIKCCIIPEKNIAAKKIVIHFAVKVKHYLNVKGKINKLNIIFKEFKIHIAFCRKNHSSDKVNNLSHHDVLVAVAHPDDETLFFNDVLKNSSDVMVLCFSNASNSIRRQEFENAMHYYGCAFLQLDFPDSSNIKYKWPKYLLRKVLIKIKSQVSPNVIYTHGDDGDYGHMHHIAVNRAVNSVWGDVCFPADAKERYVTDTEEKKRICKELYPSQALEKWFPFYFTNQQNKQQQ